MTFDLTEDEHRALAEHLKATIDADPFPHSPRIRVLRAILDKLDPVERHEPLPAPKAGEPSMALTAKRRRSRG